MKENLPGAIRVDMGEVHEGTSSQVGMLEKKREDGATMGSIGAHELDSVAETAKAAVHPFHLSFEALPVLSAAAPLRG